MSTALKSFAENSIRPIPQEAFDWYDEYAHGLIDQIGRAHV